MAPKTTQASAPDPTKITVAEKLIGAVCIFSFVSIWISSLCSPFLLLGAVWKAQYIWASTIILITAVAYLPWEKNNFTNSVHHVIHYHFPRYFKSMSLEYEGEAIEKHTAASKKQQQTFYAIHPHGAFSFGWASLFAHPHLGHVRFCFAPGLYFSPFFRLFTRAVGNPGSAGKAAMISYMKAGEDLALPPGGFEEATLTSTNHDRVFIKRRTGFVRLCLQHGIAIRPVYVFGENRLYWNLQGGWDFRLNILNKNNLPAIVTWGHPLIPLLPKSTVAMKVVVGEPIVLPKMDSPSKDVVKQWHDKYVAALVALFENHKEDYYGAEVAKTTKLEIW